MRNKRGSQSQITDKNKVFVMKRRQLLQVMGAVSLAPMVRSSRASEMPPVSSNDFTETRHPVRMEDGYFLSLTNPTATVDQIALEREALRAMATSTIKSATIRAAERYKILAGHDIPEEALVDFDKKMEEWAFHYTLLAMNSDANFPKILHHDYGPPHEWFDMSVPGGRGPGTGENVDNAYAVFPIDGYSRFELHGRRMDPATGDCPIHVVGNLSMSMNIAELGLRDTRINPDGTFVVTFGPEPANGRANHLQTTVDAKYVFIRDARMEWQQIPNAYRIYRLDPPLAPALTLDQKTALAARFIVDDVATNFWFKQMVKYVPENSVSLPDGSDFWGGQPSQVLGRGHTRLEDDEAFVLTINADGSSYHNVILYDYWLMSGNYWSRTSSLNNRQSAKNADGTYTYVFSRKDPGVHNWIDTLDLHENLFFIRFQLLPRDESGAYVAKPSASGKHVKMSHLKTVLPAGTRWITDKERETQIAERFALFQRRFEV
jgi:Protein of unknown function (DUF1214)